MVGQQSSLISASRVGAVLQQLSPLLPTASTRPLTDAAILTPATVLKTLRAVRGPFDAALTRGVFMNVWRAAGLRRDEVRTSGVLAWLLSPRESHGCGDVWLQAFWTAAHAGAPPFALLSPRAVRTEVTPQGDGSDRVDIAVEGDDFVIYIEVKIDAALQEDQLQRYAAAAELRARSLGRPHWAVIFLAEQRADLPERCSRLRWKDVAAALDNAAALMPKNSLGCLVACQFAQHVAELH